MQLTFQIRFEDPNEEFQAFLAEEWKSANLVQFGRDISGEVHQPLNVLALTDSIPPVIAGVAGCSIMGNTLRISQLLVREEYRESKGIGSTILKRLEELAKEKQWHKIRLTTIQENIDFYIKCGYTVEATLENDAFNRTWYIFSKFIESK
jgi:ribosomal protein S18 acetylase RimI-like enzyme